MPGTEVNEVLMLHKVKAGQILQTALENQIPLVMSYLSGYKWHQARVLLTNIEADNFEVKVSPRKKSQQIEIQTGQSVGMSFKCGYGSGYDKFIFDTTAAEIESSSNSAIVFSVPEQIEVVPKDSYLRVEVPESLNVNAQLWHRYSTGGEGPATADVCQSWQGKVVGISAGDVQIVVDTTQGADFQKGQSIGVRFTPLAFETPLMFNAQIKEIRSEIESESIRLDLEIIGLEASPEGRLVLQRLCNVVDEYRRMNQSGSKEQDTQPMSL